MNAIYYIRHGVIKLGLLLGSFCFATTISALEENKPAIETSYAQSRKQQLEWNIQTLVGAYERVGAHNPKWDDEARKALTLFAQSRSGDSSPDLNPQMREHSRAAMGAGCADPLVRYALFKSLEDLPGGITPERKAEMRKIADRVVTTDYPAIRKFYACARAAGSEKDRAGRRFAPETTVFRDKAEQYLFEVLKDKTIPALEIHDACRSFGKVIDDDSDAFKKFCQAIEEPINRNWTNAWLLPLIRGDLYLDHAWAARGTGTADTVADSGWKLFGERLKVAASELETAWKVNPSEPHAAISMINVGKGLGLDEDQLEKWFQRAMSADTNSYVACQAKLSYLQPKWLGSSPKALAFAQQCVDSTNWGGNVAIIGVDVFEKLAEYVPASERAAYWKNPEIWPRMKAAYQKYFDTTPGPQTSTRSKWLLYAFRCERWNEFNTMAGKMSSVHYSVFGGKEKFDDMVLTAKEKAAKHKE